MSIHGSGINSLRESRQLNRSVDLNSTKDDIDGSEFNDDFDDFVEGDGAVFIQPKIVESKIISSIRFAKMLYFNLYYIFLCFILELSSMLFQFYISVKAKTEDIVRLVLCIVWFIAKFWSIKLGNHANVRGDVKIVYNF